MSRFLLLSVIVASLSTIVGCGASSHATHATPSSPASAEARDESSWTPPQEMAMSFDGAQSREATERANAKSLSYRPNRLNRPARGAVHAATY